MVCFERKAPKKKQEARICKKTKKTKKTTTASPRNILSSPEVATSLTPGEAGLKHVALVDVKCGVFRRRGWGVRVCGKDFLFKSLWSLVVVGFFFVKHH